MTKLSLKAIYLVTVMVGLVGSYFLCFSPLVKGSTTMKGSQVNGQFVPPVFDPIDPIDMKRITSGNY
jgi:hypothetical protein